MEILDETTHESENLALNLLGNTCVQFFSCFVSPSHSHKMLGNAPWGPRCFDLGTPPGTPCWPHGPGSFAALPLLPPKHGMKHRAVLDRALEFLARV